MSDSTSAEVPAVVEADEQSQLQRPNYLGKIGEVGGPPPPLPDEPDTVAFDTRRCKFLGKRTPRLKPNEEQDNIVAPVLADRVVERQPNAASVDESQAVFDKLWDSIDPSLTTKYPKEPKMLEDLLEYRKNGMDKVSLKKRLGQEMQSRLRSGKPDPIAASMSDFSLHPDDAGNFGIKFEMLTDEEIVDMSVALIFSTSEWDLRNNEPNFGGLLDERMGPLDRMIHLGDGHQEKARCKTCAGVNNCDPHLETRPGESGECYGHFGRIELPAAVYNVMVAHLVRHIMASFCWHCGKLPGDLERNNKAIADMHKLCTDKYEKLLFLSGRFGKDKHCLQCCVSRRCDRCRDAPTQCEECSVFICFRPQVRTLRQMENDDKRKRSDFDEAHESIDVDENDIDDTNERDAIRRGTDYMGFPYKMFLDGNADGHIESYQRFAKAVGYEEGQNMFVLHGERVRDIIVMMDPSFLQLFIDSEMESHATILSWFRSFVPRAVPIAPNAVRPTSVGDSEDDHSLNDTTRFYRVFLHYVHKLSVCLDPAAKNNPEVLGRTYDSLFSSRRNQWFRMNHLLDFVFIEQYGEMQYQYARGIADDIAIKFMPTHLKKRQKGAGGAGAKKSSTFESAAANIGGAKASTIISFKRRLHGKEGRFRGNLVAKRVEQSSRSVITPDPRLKIGQVALPRMFASVFSIRETIFSLNVMQMAIIGERLRNDWTAGISRTRCGRNKPADEKLYMDSRSDFCLFNAANTNRQRVSSDLQRNTRANAIVMGQPLYRNPDMGEAGSALERPLRDGDFVISNRQPTLHEQGMMAEEVVMFDNDGCNTVDDIRFNRPLDSVPLTIRKAVQSTTQYNADFDGDEMNEHNPSGSLLARAEMLLLMKVSDKIISTRDMSPACGLKQDSATGMWLLTSRDVFLTREETVQIMYAASEVYSGSEFTKQTYRLALQLPRPAVTKIVRDTKTREVLQRVELWTGAQVASVVFPECFNYRIGSLHPTSMDYTPLAPLPANATEKQRKEREEKRRKVRDNVNGPMLVYDGELMYGRLDKRSCGDKHGAITQAIIRRVTAISIDEPLLTLKERREDKFNWSHANRARNEQEACAFLDRCGWVAVEFMTHSLFGTGLDACMLERDDPMYAKVKQTLQKAIIDIAQLTADKRMEIAIREENKHRAADDQLPWKPNYKIIHGGNYSDRVSEIERNALEIQGKAFQSSMADAAENLPFGNKFNPMLFSGGKGKPENQTGIVLAVYAQQLEGRRVIDKYVGSINLSQTNAASGVDRKRDANECETTWPVYNYRGSTMITRKTIERAPSSRMLDNLLARNSPHMPAGVYPNALEAALITESYLSGLSARSFYSHAQAAREGLCDTAVKTQDTGSEQRLAMKSCEDVSVRYDRTVRGCTNEVIAFRYGDTGYDPKRLEKKSLDFTGWKHESVRNHLYYRVSDECLSFATPRDLQSLQRERRQIDKCLALARSVLSRANESTRIITPGNIESSIVELMTFFGHPTTHALWTEENNPNVRWHYTAAANSAFIQNRSRASLDSPAVAQYVDYLAFVRHQTAKFGNLGRLTEGEAARAVDAAVVKWRRDGLCDAITECEIRMRLCSKQVTRRYEMSRACLDAILKCYEFVLNEAMAPAGEAVGALMVTSVGQPATQMTLNSFHMTGKSNVGVISGLPRMQEISHVTATARMKGLKAVIALKEQAFIFARGQRDVIARMVSLMTHGEDDVSNFAAHSLHTGRLLRTSRRHTTEALIVMRAKATLRGAARQSRFSEASNKKEHVTTKRALANSLLSAINRLTGTKTTPSIVQMMLGDFTSDWRTEKFAGAAHGKTTSLPIDNIEAHTLLTARVTHAFVQTRQTTSALLVESVWRSLLPFVGSDVRHVVFTYAEQVDAFRLAIGLLECTEKIESQIYANIRQSRQMIFVDLIDSNDTHALSFQHRCLAKWTSEELKRTGEQILESNGSVLRNASARGLLRNMIATHLVDLTESFGILYQPLVYDAEEKTLSVQFPDQPQADSEIDGDAMLMIYQNQIERRRVDLLERAQVAEECAGIAVTPEERASAQHMQEEVEIEINAVMAPFVAKKLRAKQMETQAQADNDLIADASERSMCQWFYGNRLFAKQIYCKKEDCAIARINPTDSYHCEAACGCLSAMVAVFRLDRRWFENNKLEPKALQRSLQRELGEHFHVLVGDVNSEKYIPMHIRVRTCSLADVAKQINVNRFVDVNNFGVTTADEINRVYDDESMPPAIAEEPAQETTGDAEPTEGVEGEAVEDAEDDIDEFIASSGVTRVTRAAVKRQRVLSKQCVKASDGPLAILDHIIFIVLNHRVCGPSRGTAVMFDDDVRQTYHPEIGFENVTHTTIANNSSEFNFALNLRGVDTQNSRSNSVHDVCDVYGIEAGREAIIGEYAEVLRDGSYVNRSHLAVRADVQTRHGYLAPLTADGLRAENHDVIQSASHRENADTVVDAALHGKSTYPLTSPSACIAVGVPVRHIGTGIVTLIQKPYDEREFAYIQPEPREILEMNMSEIESIMSIVEQRQQFSMSDYGPLEACNTDQVPVNPKEFFAEVARRREEKRRDIAARKLRAEGLSDDEIRTFFETTRSGDRLEFESMIAAHRKASGKDTAVVNGIALDQVSKEVADRIQDEMCSSTTIAAPQSSSAAPTMQLPYGFHAALLDFEAESGIKIIDTSGSESGGDDDNANGAAFSPPHGEMPTQSAAAPDTTPHEQALQSVRNDMLQMPSPHDDLNTMMANRGVRASLGLHSHILLDDDDVDDKSRPTLTVADDEPAQINSPDCSSNDGESDNESSSGKSSSDDAQEETHIANFRNQALKESTLVFPLGADEMSADTMQTIERRKYLATIDGDSTDAQNRAAAAAVQHATVPLNRDTKRKFAEANRPWRRQEIVKQPTPPRVVVAPVIRQQHRFAQTTRSFAKQMMYRPPPQRSSVVDEYDPMHSWKVPTQAPGVPTVPAPPVPVEQHKSTITSPAAAAEQYDPVNNFISKKRALNTDVPKTLPNVESAGVTTSINTATTPTVTPPARIAQPLAASNMQHQTEKIIDLFASFTILKPAIAAPAPRPVVETPARTQVPVVAKADVFQVPNEVWADGVLLADYNDFDYSSVDTDFMGNADRRFF